MPYPGGALCAHQSRSAGSLQILRDVRRNLHVAAFGDEVCGVITLVRSKRDAMGAGQTFGHQQRGIAFRRTVGSRGECRNHQTIAVLCQQMAAIGSVPRCLPRLLRDSMASGSVVDNGSGC